jgi:hypothetical protein
MREQIQLVRERVLQIQETGRAKPGAESSEKR